MKPNITVAHDESCLKVEISYPTDKSVGFVSFTLAKGEGGDCDWSGGVRADLGVFSMARVQQVFRGESESLDECIGKTKLLMRHVVDPKPGYAIGIADGDKRCQIFLEPFEALAISESLYPAFFFVSFVKGVC